MNATKGDFQFQENDLISILKNGQILAQNRRGKIGYICSENWNFEKAQIVCKQAGFNSTLAYKEFAKNENYEFSIFDLGNIHKPHGQNMTIFDPILVHF